MKFEIDIVYLYVYIYYLRIYVFIYNRFVKVFIGMLNIKCMLVVTFRLEGEGRIIIEVYIVE